MNIAITTREWKDGPHEKQYFKGKCYGCGKIRHVKKDY
jgi:hypothetical protein